jgi:hypothetical protein
MKWILFVLLANHPLQATEFGGHQACVDAAIEVEKRVKKHHSDWFRASVWCMPKDAREKPNGKKSSWM